MFSDKKLKKKIEALKGRIELAEVLIEKKDKQLITAWSAYDRLEMQVMNLKKSKEYENSERKAFINRVLAVVAQLKLLEESKILKRLIDFDYQKFIRDIKEII